MWIIYTMFGILGLFALLLLIAVINTVIIKDRSEVAKICEPDSKETDKLAKEFSKLIKIDTISYEKEKNNIEKFDELHKTMEDLFPNVWKKMEKNFFEGGSLLFKWIGKSDKKPMVLMAHQDVVSASLKGWDFPPFSGKVTDTEVYGRGTLDTKSTLYTFFKACEELIKEGFKPEHDIYLSSATDEEISGFGASLSVKYFQDKGITPYLVLDEGGAIVTNSLPSVKRPLGMIGVIEKGYCNIKFTAKSRGGHSSTPPKHTPLARLAAFVNDVETDFPLKTKMIDEVRDIFKTAAPHMSFGYRLLFGNMWLFKPLITMLLPKINSFGRALLSTTIAFTMCNGSSAANVIPSEAYVIANLRTHPIQNIEESFSELERIAKKYDLEAEITESREASPISNTDNEAYKYLLETILKAYPDVVTSPYVMLGGTDCRFFSEITESAYRFSPMRMDNSELKKIHGKNESIKKSSLVEARDFYKGFIKNHK